jgi:hypothetical protein
LTEESISEKGTRNEAKQIEKMSVAVEMIDFRPLAVVGSLMIMWVILSFIDHLYRTIWTYSGYALFSIAILALLFLQSNRKISIDNERFLMHIPLFGKKINKI